MVRGVRKRRWTQNPTNREHAGSNFVVTFWWNIKFFELLLTELLNWSRDCRTHENLSSSNSGGHFGEDLKRIHKRNAKLQCLEVQEILKCLSNGAQRVDTFLGECPWSLIVNSIFVTFWDKRAQPKSLSNSKGSRSIRELVVFGVRLVSYEMPKGVTNFLDLGRGKVFLVLGSLIRNPLKNYGAG